MSGVLTLSKSRGGGVVAPDGLPGGTKMLFQQTAAPTGWTKDTAHTDKALRLTSGTVGTGRICFSDSNHLHDKCGPSTRYLRNS